MYRYQWVFLLGVLCGVVVCGVEETLQDRKTVAGNDGDDAVIRNKDVDGSVVNGEDGLGETAGNRDGRDFANDQWRAVHQFPNYQTSWVPEEHSSNSAGDPPVQKRRRLRKRKRRPQPQHIYIPRPETADSAETFDTQRPVLRKRPQHLDELREPSWKEMEDEGTASRPYNRRRISPVYPMDGGGGVQTTGTLSASLQFGEADDSPPVPAELRKAPPPQELYPESSTVPDLKTLLKQNGGLSLSEILQQKNLSLSDLLRGQHEAIAALTERPSNLNADLVISEYKNPTSDDGKLLESGYKRLPPSVRKTVNRNYDSENESTESVFNKDVINAQRKRLSVMYNKENKLYSDVTKYDVITEATTEKRIFVPSHPKYYTSIDFRPELEDVSEKIFNSERTKATTMDYIEPETTTIIMTTTPIMTTMKPLISNVINHLPVRPKLKNKLPVTSAKLKKPTTPNLNKPVTENYETLSQATLPEKAIKIDLNDLFGFNGLLKDNKSSDVGPYKMSIDLEEMVRTTTSSTTTTEESEVESIQTNLVTDYSTTWKSDVDVENVTPPEKLKNVSAKEEIMEVLQDENTKEKLTKVLESRNMTIDELVEQRERGSSQRHLADIFHNKTKEPEAVEVVHIRNPIHRHKYPSSYDRKAKNTPIVEEKKIASVLKTQPKVIEVKTTTSPTTTTVVAPSSTNKVINPIEHTGITSFPSYKIETDKTGLGKELLNVPIWKTIYPTMRSDSLSGLNFPVGTVESVDQSNDLFLKEMQEIDEIENTIADAVNEEEERFIRNHYEKTNDDDYFNLPYGVKSAIFASLAIIGISLIIFLTILVIFRWMQRHKKRLSYNSDSFSGSKIKSPILDIDPLARRSLRTIMNETLGRKKNPYKNHLQSMTDSWDSDGGVSAVKSYK